MSLSPRARGVIFAQLNALFAGSMMAAGKEVTGTHLGSAALEPQRFVALMYIIVVPVNTAWWLLTHYGILKPLHQQETRHGNGRMSFTGWLWLLGHTCASAFGIIGLWEGLSLASSAAGSLLSRTEVVIAILLGMIFLSERFTRWHWGGFTLTIIGLALVKWGEITVTWEAFGFLMAGALGFGLAEFTGKMAVKHVPVPRLVVIRGWVMCSILVANWWLRYPGWPELNGAMWFWLVLSAILGPVLARNNYMLALSYLPVSQVVVLNQAQPIYAAVVGFLLREEIPLPLFYLGAASIILGNIILIISRERSKAAQIAST